MARILVTGGAGYVGSHLVAALCDLGNDSVVVYDNLQTGHRAAVHPDAELIIGDLTDQRHLDHVLHDGEFDAVFHFAALSQVGESMRDPMRYLRRNTDTSLNLIDACIRNDVNRFVFSSTAALFNPQDGQRIRETDPIDPQSAYGDSKWMIERALHWADQVHGMRSACLRYFNAAGADPEGRVGEDHTPETHLIPLVIDAAVGRRRHVEVFGNDYETKDGTCIRDYVHVSDLADAHILALKQLDVGSLAWNLGCGTGYSVKEVIRMVERISGRKVPQIVSPRRAGDTAVLVAASDKAMSHGWQPKYNLFDIVRTAFNWRQKNPHGYTG